MKRPCSPIGLAVALLVVAFGTTAAQEPLPPGAVVRVGSTRLRHVDASGLAYSHDGKRLATSGMETRIWDTATGRQLLSIPIPAFFVPPDGQTLVSLGSDHVIRFWDAATGKELRQFRPARPDSASLAVSPEGQILAVGNWNLEVSLYRAATFEKLHTFSGLPPGAPPLEKATQQQQVERIVHSLHFTPDGKTLVAAGTDGVLRVLDVNGRQEQRQLTRSLRYHTTVIMSRDGKCVASSAVTGVAKDGGVAPAAITVWELATGRIVFSMPQAISIYGMAFSPDGKLLAVNGHMDANPRARGIQLRVWELGTGKVQFTSTPQAAGGAMSFSPDGKTLSCVGRGLCQWDVATWRELRSPEGHTSGITGVAFAPDGKTIVSSSHDTTLRLWDAVSGKELRRFTGHTMPVYSMALSQDGKRVGACGFDDTARVWDVATGKEVAKFPTSDARCVGFSPDGKQLAVGGYNLTVQLWDMATRKEVRKMVGYGGLGISCGWEFRWAPDGRTLAGVGQRANDNAFHLLVWDARSGREVAALAPLASRIGAIAYAPDAEVIAWWADDNVYIWDTRVKKQVRVLTKIRPGALAISPDGKWLFAGGKLLDFGGGKEVHDFGGEIPVAAFSLDSRRLVTGSGDASLLVWDVVRLRESLRDGR